METLLPKGGGSNKSTIIVTAPTGSLVYIINQDGKRKDATGEESRNLWPYIELEDRTHNGYTFHSTEEGILVNGTGNGENALSNTCYLNLAPGTYTVCGNGAETSPLLANVRVKDANGQNTWYAPGHTFTLNGTEQSVAIYLQVFTSTATFNNVLYKPMLASGSKNIPFEQYYEGSRWAFKNCVIGTWTIHASLNGDTASSVLEITEEDQRMRYYVNIGYQMYASDFDWSQFGTHGVDYVITYDDGTPIPQNLWATEKNWAAALLTSNSLHALKDGKIDVFAVAGGRSATKSSYTEGDETHFSSTAGQGGANEIFTDVEIREGTQYDVIIGAADGSTSFGADISVDGEGEPTSGFAGDAGYVFSSPGTKYGVNGASGTAADAAETRPNTGNGASCYQEWYDKGPTLGTGSSGIVIIRNARG